MFLIEKQETFLTSSSAASQILKNNFRRMSSHYSMKHQYLHFLYTDTDTSDTSSILICEVSSYLIKGVVWF